MTEIVTAEQCDQLADILSRGGVIGIPTDTVYGIAARCDQPDAVARLFQLKRRPGEVALPVLVASVEQIRSLGIEISERAMKLARAFWPGALTIVISAPSDIAHRVGATESIGFRIPAHHELLELLTRTGPLAVTSANHHGETPCHSAQEVALIFESENALDAIFDAGVCSGDVSSVIDVSMEPWVIRRVGAISEEALSRALD